MNNSHISYMILLKIILSSIPRLDETQYLNVLTNSMGQSPSWEANSHSASQEIARL
jgi:hypothetical protein